jgi:hypothetical protein
MGFGSSSIETTSSSSSWKLWNSMREFVEKSGRAAVVDGGLATELERHGADLNDPLWSAKCLLSSPHLIRQVLSLSLSLSLQLLGSWVCCGDLVLKISFVYLFGAFFL